MRSVASKYILLTASAMAMLVLSQMATSASAGGFYMKTVDTVVGSYMIDGTTVYFVSHITGIMRWIVEPTGYIPWQDGMIPIDGQLRVVSSSLEHERLFYDDTHVSIKSFSGKYVGTFEVVPAPPGIPGLPPYIPTPKNGLMNTHTVMKKYDQLGAYKQHDIVKYVDFVPEVLLQKVLLPPMPPGKMSALLTGAITDHGIDNDEDLLYENLVVSVEVRVRTPGLYTVMISGLQDSFHNWIGVSGMNSQSLSRGTHLVEVLLNGPSIYVSGLNPSIISSIDLFDEYFTLLGSVQEVSLSREYSFEEFERPPAVLTGVIYDDGFDDDGDGAFDYLGVGVEVEVSAPGFYSVDASGLRDADYNYVNVWDSESAFLDVGTQTVKLALNGPSIYASGVNVSFVSSINLVDEYFNLLDYAFDIPLSTEYTYTQFDVPGASLTGSIADQGVDADDPLDGTFDYLWIGVEIEVLEAGLYTVQTDGLLDEENNFIGIWGSNSTYLDVGNQLVYLQLDGPTIYMQGLNPSRVSSVTLFDGNYNSLGRIDDIPLLGTYLYTDFDASP